MIKGDSYKCQNGRPWLVPGSKVIVSPGVLVKQPYECSIVEEVVNWTYGKRLELCTHKHGGHSAVIWEYWVHRLTPVNQ